MKNADDGMKKRTRRSMKNKNMISKFKVMFNNMRGYKLKKDTLMQIIQEEKTVVMGIAETNLENGEIIEKIEGYEVKRKDRKRKGGGVMLIYRKALENMVMEEEDLGDDEILWITIRNKNITIKVGVVYMPQENKTTVAELQRLYKKIGKEVEKATMENARVVLMGDFNAKIGDGELEMASKGGKVLKEMAEKQDMLIVNTDERCEGKWTRMMGDERSVLDYMMVKNDDKDYIQKIYIDEEKNMTPYWITKEEDQRIIYADHCMMMMIIDWKMMLVETAVNKKYMGKKEYDNYRREIEENNVSRILLEGSDFKQAYTKWSETVMKIADKNSKRRKNQQTWKVNRLLQMAKKRISRKQKQRKMSKEVRRLLKVQKTLIDEHILKEIKERKRVQIDKTVEDIRNKGGINSNALYEVRNRIIGRKREGKHAIEDQYGVVQTKEEDIKTVYEQYFRTLLGKEQRCEGKYGEEIEENVERVYKSMELVAEREESEPIEEELVRKIIGQLKKKKSSDRDGWRNELVKQGGEEMIRSMTIISDNVIGAMNIPNEFNLMTIFATHKKNSKLKMKNKRGLFLTNVISKIMEKIIKERNRGSMQKNASVMQNGGKKGCSSIDNLIMVWSVIERNKYLGKDTYLVFIDMEKCFDLLWLEDGIIELWKDGTNIKDAVVIKKMNEESIAVVRTPVGETQPIRLNNIVRQGTVSGPDICCSSTGRVNQMGRSLNTMYGPYIEIGAPVYVDDISIASGVTTANDLIYNCSLLEERKKMTVNTEPDKSGCLCIKSGGDQPEDVLTMTVKNGWINRLKEYQLLGTWMNEEGNYSTSVMKMGKRIPLMSISTKQVANSYTIGGYAMEARMNLVEVVCMPGLLHGSEAVPNLDEEMQEIEKVQHKLLCDVMGLPLSTPYMPLLMEMGMWTMNYRIQYRKMMLYHNLIHSDSERMARRMIIYQREENRIGTWANGVIKSIKQAGIEMKPEDVIKSKWKREVKAQLGKMNEKEVREKCKEQRKGRTICDGKWGKKDYMEMQIGEAREIMKTRLHMMPLPCNYGGSDDGCPLCNVSGKVDTEHYLRCEGVKYLRKKWGLNEEVRIGTEKVSELRNLSKYLRQICTLLGTGKSERG